ncbi:hypothetical protein N7468_009302 [Penicillium chermesinum]|uniref:Uncharacterized protein n=1 Tax=Penicillium chermesinum TaxID=63820 RepID=A0A9W9TEW1_9EURO|nr:uncharacterized protein N7468_009302 [Penicillium chermesinum]KAJ5220098.1 hypothetical protein N7468_009302 [Penicillium chermesinum]KAJ6157545.1 hypothetical protein N7470_005137 [Penicillium chermesinum]
MENKGSKQDEQNPLQGILLQGIPLQGIGAKFSDSMYPYSGSSHPGSPEFQGNNDSSTPRGDVPTEPITSETESPPWSPVRATRSGKD